MPPQASQRTQCKKTSSALGRMIETLIAIAGAAAGSRRRKGNQYPRLSRRTARRKLRSAIRIWLDDVICHGIYQGFMGVLTIFSVIMLIFETDIEAKQETIKGTWLQPTTLAVLAFFVIDVVLRIFVYRAEFFQRFLDQLDLFIVLIDVLLDLVFGMLPEGIPSVSFLKVFRIIRLSRIFGSMSEFQELYLIMLGIVSSVRALVFGSILLCVALVVFSILAVQYMHPETLRLHNEGFFADCEDCHSAFSSVRKSTMTFMRTVIAGDSWGQLAVPLVENSSVSAVILFLAFITLNLGLLNTIAAVIVDRQAQARESDHAYMRMLQNEELSQSYSLLQDIFEEMDVDGSGAFDVQEVMAHYDTTAELRELLNAMDIYKSDLPVIMDMIDTDGSGDVTYKEFVAGLHDLRYENTHTILKFIKHYSQETFKAIKTQSHTTRVAEDMKRASLLQKRASRLQNCAREGQQATEEILGSTGVDTAGGPNASGPVPDPLRENSMRDVWLAEGHVTSVKCLPAEVSEVRSKQENPCRLASARGTKGPMSDSAGGPSLHSRVADRPSPNLLFGCTMCEPTRGGSSRGGDMQAVTGKRGRPY
eukprot:CAMPEP_0117493150 /NCGR_PEP_ID=MMETSP0784-20121206/18950_1 /TAXON_ID=39447 /ORGANISM="" /LENGTH=590 /DNA_ID=CAMNT_0005287995 /DNA_START=80 /DNA_END=1852 /DNA_ORIENTATION=-